MTLDEIKIIMQNRLITLSEARKAAVSAGDLEKVVQIDGDLTTTVTSLEKLSQIISNEG